MSKLEPGIELRSEFCRFGLLSCDINARYDVRNQRVGSLVDLVLDWCKPRAAGPKFKLESTLGRPGGELLPEGASPTIPGSTEVQAGR